MYFSSACKYTDKQTDECFIGQLKLLMSVFDPVTATVYSSESLLCSDFCLLCFIRYILYKKPVQILDGLDYFYIYPNTATFQPNDKKKIDDPKGILVHTLDPLFKYDKNIPVSIISETQPLVSIFLSFQ